jgi:hypothetical protein
MSTTKIDFEHLGLRCRATIYVEPATRDYPGDASVDEIEAWVGDEELPPEIVEHLRDELDKAALEAYAR